MKNAWIQQIFDSRQAQSGGLVRRAISSVITYASLSELEDEVRLRGFHMFIVGAQVLILCNTGSLNVIC